MNKEKLTELVYEHCRSSMWTSKQVVEKVLDELFPNHCGMPPENTIDELVVIVKNYKNTGKGLQDTVEKIYNILSCTNQNVTKISFNPSDFGPANHTPYCSLSDFAKGIKEDSDDIAKFLTADINQQLAKNVAKNLFNPGSAINEAHQLIEKHLQVKTEQQVKLMGEVYSKQCVLSDLGLLTRMIKDTTNLNVQDIAAMKIHFGLCQDICQAAIERENLPAGKIIPWKIKSYYTDKDGKDITDINDDWDITEDEKMELTYLQDQRTAEENGIESCPPKPKIEYSSVLPGHVPLPGVVEAYLPQEKKTQVPTSYCKSTEYKTLVKELADDIVGVAGIAGGWFLK